MCVCVCVCVWVCVCVLFLCISHVYTLTLEFLCMCVFRPCTYKPCLYCESNFELLGVYICVFCSCVYKPCNHVYSLTLNLLCVYVCIPFLCKYYKPYLYSECKSAYYWCFPSFPSAPGLYYLYCFKSLFSSSFSHVCLMLSFDLCLVATVRPLFLVTTVEPL